MSSSTQKSSCASGLGGDGGIINKRGSLVFYAIEIEFNSISDCCYEVRLHPARDLDRGFRASFLLILYYDRCSIDHQEMKPNAPLIA